MSEQVNVRYMVGDVREAVDWYVRHFGFRVVLASPAFASVERGALRLLLSGRASSAGRPMPDGRQPEPGGWNRFQVLVDDIGPEVERLRKAGVTFRNAIVTGPGGSQILAEDPSGNVVEVFQRRPWRSRPHRRARPDRRSASPQGFGGSDFRRTCTAASSWASWPFSPSGSST